MSDAHRGNDVGVFQLFPDKVPSFSRDVRVLFSKYHLANKLMIQISVSFALEGGDDTHNEFTLARQISPANPDKAIVALPFAECG